MSMEGGAPEDLVINLTRREIDERNLLPNCAVDILPLNRVEVKSAYLDGVKSGFIAIVKPRSSHPVGKAEHLLAIGDFQPVHPNFPAAVRNPGITFSSIVAFVPESAVIR